MPVCIGDLPSSNYQVSYDVPAEEVAAYLHRHENIPGVMIFDRERLLGIIPRMKMFERLGQRYGIELFLQKPILKLQQEIGAQMFSLYSHLRVDDAVKRGLNRDLHTIYDPIIVSFEDNRYRLLDMYTLLLSQSQTLENINGLMSSITHIEKSMARNVEHSDMLELIMDTLKRIVPFHKSSILLKRPLDGPTKFGEMIVHPSADHALEQNNTYKMILEMRQSLCVDDVSTMPLWIGHNGDSNARAWMGIPLSDRTGTLGLLSLSRLSPSPYTSNEKEIATTFARYLGVTLGELIVKRSGSKTEPVSRNRSSDTNKPKTIMI